MKYNVNGVKGFSAKILIFYFIKKNWVFFWRYLHYTLMMNDPRGSLVLWGRETAVGIKTKGITLIVILLKGREL